jgi:transposase
MIREKIRPTQGIEGARRATEIPWVEPAKGGSSVQPLRVDSPDPEVPEKARRRRFSAEYKLSILRQAEACQEPGSLGALLRREGIYSSNLTTWRRQSDEGILCALQPKPRGRKASPRNILRAKVEQLSRENDRLQKRLKQAELIIEVQKKISQMLGIPLEPSEKGGDA